MGGQGGGFGRIMDMLGWNGPKAFAKSYRGKNSALTNLLDPGGFLVKAEESSPRPPKPIDTTQTDAANEARALERRRLTGGSGTTYSRKADALSSTVGKRLLGGSQ